VGGMDKPPQTSAAARDLETDLNSSLDALFGPLN